MNILILSWRGPGHPHAGGAEKVTHEHVKGWVKAGHSAILFTSNYPGCKGEEIIDGVKIKRSGSQILGVHLKAFWWYISEKHERFDLIIDQFHGIPFFTSFFVRTKKLAFIHEVTKEVWSLNPLSKPFNLIPAIFGTLFEPFIFKLLYKNIPFMTVSESTKKDLVSFGIPSSNITVIHNGISIPRGIKKYPKENKKTLIYLGAISKDKGIEDAIKVFSYISNIKKDWQLWVVGKSDPTYMKSLENLINRLKLKDKVKFWGYVSENKKFELLGKSHALINPSIREGWGLVVIEAAAVGTPTVAYDVPGLRDSIINGQTGILSSTHSVKGLAEAVISLINNKDKYDHISGNAIAWSKRFSWERASKMSLNLIEEIAG